MKLKRRAISAFTAAVLAAGMVAGSVLPASAASVGTVNLSNVAAIQSSTKDMSIVDSKGRTWWITVTTTWQRLSSTKAVLRVINLRPKTFPGGECLSINVGSTTNINYYNGPRTLCKTGLLSYSPMKTVNAYSGTTILGQLWLDMPDPWAPFSGGNRNITIEYHS